MDLISYLALAQFEKDDVSLERIINVPKRGIGAGTLKKMTTYRREDMSFLDAVRLVVSKQVLSAKIYKELKSFVELIDDIKNMAPDQAIREVIDRTNYMQYLEAYAKGNAKDMTARQENIEQLIYSASQKDTLLDFLEEASLVKEDKEEDGEENDRGVRLSTIHASKGLEYNAVFVIGCEEKLFPHWKSMESTADMEEERRLMYVSVTRAERYLYLSSVEFRRGQYSSASRFLEEIEGYLQEQWAK